MVEVVPDERQFFALPLKCGDLGTVNPVVIADCYYILHFTPLPFYRALF